MTGCICQNLKNSTQKLVSFRLYKLCLNKKNVFLKKATDHCWNKLEFSLVICFGTFVKSRASEQ